MQPLHLFTPSAQSLICPSLLYLEAQKYIQSSNYLKAINNLQFCCKVEPQNLNYWLLLADCYNQIGLKAESYSTYKFASQIFNHSDLSLIIASIAQEMGLISESLQYYTLSISQNRQNFNSYNNKGNLLRSLQKYNEAIEVFNIGIQMCGANQHLYNNLGNCFIELDMLQEAYQCYSEALKLEPGMVAAHCNLSAVLKAQGRIPEAITYCSIALNLDPSFSDAYACMGSILKDTQDLNRSIEFYKQAVHLNPSSISSLFNLANLLKDSGELSQSIHLYEKIIELSPWHHEAFSFMVYSKIFICDWRDIKSNFEKLAICIKEQIDSGTLPSVQPFHTFVYPLAPEDKLVIAKAYAKFSAGLVKNYLPFCKTVRNEKIRVGYVSSDFTDHPLCHLMQNVFGFHDRKCFEVYLFAISPDDGSEYRAKVVAGSDFFFDLSGVQDSYVLANEVYKCRIDVLFNLNGYTRGSRNEIFALRPGRIQISYMGFAGSLGADYIDYLITDKHTSPPSLSYLYTEKLIWMPHSYFVNDYQQSAQYVLSTSRPSRSNLLPEDKFVFANFNQLYKIDPDTFEIWMRILHQVPNSVLWLLRFPAAGEENIKKHASTLGIDTKRIWFTDVTNKKDHINRCFLADLCLDTPLCNGHTTTCDSLWSGLPMVTLPLKNLVSRVAAGLCYAVGMPEFVVSSAQEYESLAVRLATGKVESDLEKGLGAEERKRLGSSELKLLRQKLERNKVKEACFDTKLWVRNLEKALKVVVELDKKGEKPKHVEVVG